MHSSTRDSSCHCYNCSIQKNCQGSWSLRIRFAGQKWRIDFDQKVMPRGANTMSTKSGDRSFVLSVSFNYMKKYGKKKKPRKMSPK